MTAFISNVWDAQDLCSECTLQLIGLSCRPQLTILHHDPENPQITGMQFFAIHQELGEIPIDKRSFMLLLKLAAKINSLQKKPIAELTP